MGCDYKSMKLFAAPNLLGDAEWVLFLVRRLTEWRRFHFWYQLRDALNSGSSLNSLAFRHSINPLTAIPMQNEVRRLPNDRKDKNLTRLEFVFTFVKTGQWESFIPNVVTWYYDSFESRTFNWHSLCNQLIDLFRDLCFCCFTIQNQCSHFIWVLIRCFSIE